MGFQEYKILKGKNQKDDFIHINHGKGRIQATLTRLVFQDKDTQQYIAMVPSLELTGYGQTKKKAFEMLKFSLDDYYTHLIKLSSTKMAIELQKLGWKKNKLKNKDYSKAYVDLNGNLKEFNAIEETIQSDQLTLA